MSKFNYSQNSQSSTDSITIKIPKYYIVNANKAFTELKGLKKVIEYQDKALQLKSSETLELQKAYTHLQTADSLNKIIIVDLNTVSDSYKKINQDYKKALKKEKLQTIGISVSVPVAAILGFLLGFYLH